MGHAVSLLPGGAGFAASIAGLPGSHACVSVGPPLSASGPSLGSIGDAVVPTWSPFALSTRLGHLNPLPMRLNPSELRSDPSSRQSGAKVLELGFAPSWRLPA